MNKVALLLLAGSALATPVVAQMVQAPHIEAELVSEYEQIVAGKPFPLALRLKPEKDWHIYWKNPGDSGLAPALEWHLPGNWKQSELHWPTPTRIPFGPLVNFGYEEETLLIIEPVVAAENSNQVKISLDAEWLVCKEECIPGGASFTISREISSNKTLTPSKFSPQFARARADWPATHLEIPLKASRDDKSFKIELPKNLAKKDLFFFPEISGLIENAQPQILSFEQAQVAVLKIDRARNSKKNISGLKGLLVGAAGWLGADQPRSLAIDLALPVTPQPQIATAEASSSPARQTQEVPIDPQSSLTFLPAILFAFIGGLILNLMPCIFPVLSIKILGFVQQSGGDSSNTRKHGLVFGAGVIISFWLLAGILLSLRATGAGLGWGFQLQDPNFIVLLALLLFALALNLLGVFELGGVIQRTAGRVNVDTSLSGSFFSGVLATVLATPCTAPFMGSALAYALSVSAAEALIIFSALGIGMALPYVVLSFNPQLLRFLPRPGDWMVTFKQLMAFPLFLTVLWLAWVLGLQTDLDTVVRLLASFILLGFAAWLVGGFGGIEVKPAQRASIRIASILLVISAYFLPTSNPPLDRSSSNAVFQDSHGLAWQPYSQALVDKLVSEHRAIYIDFTAAWCLTCQVNKRLVFNSTEVLELLTQKDVTLVRADWTKRDPEITQALARYKRSGVPLNLIYLPGKDAPEILPAILTPGLVAQELRKIY